ncbi:MAG: hypothetical protein RLZZ628_1340 [Bacteroidota bacterium]|jgi:hypothetical protein
MTNTKLSFLLLLMAILFKTNSYCQTVTFTTSTAVIPNPERGFYYHSETAPLSANFTGLSVSSMAALRNGRIVNGTSITTPITLVLRLYYIGDFINSDFTNNYLTKITDDLTAARTAGVKLILRFAYSNQNATAPFNASKTQILSHITQLTPLLQANSDIIATVQMGFIGAWGENWTTTDFGIPPLNATNWQDRKDIFDALLAAVPTNRMIQVRVPQMKQKFAEGISAPITSLAQNVRIGHHNDCFLYNYNDQGTYRNVSTDVSDTTTFKAYLKTDVDRNVVVGGETCGGNYLNANCLANSGQAENEMKRFRYSFLNSGYSPTTLGLWTSCLDVISQKLGYRFALVNATYPTTVTNGSEMNIQFSVRNDGFARLYNPRKVEFVLRNVATNTRYYALVNTNPCQWEVDATTTVNESFCLNTMPNGIYDLFLNLPDAATSLYNKPNYAIQLANDNVWESSTGYNKLSINANQQITINGSGGTCTRSLTPFSTSSALPVELVNFYAQTNGAEVTLHWTTVSEMKARKFEIERSTDGKTFSKIGEVLAKGEYSIYNFADEHSFDISYYRLRQIDLDGKETFSKIVSIIHTHNEIQLFPNPTMGKIYIPSSDFQWNRISIFNHLGQILIEKAAVEHEIDLSHLPNGIYYIEISSDMKKSQKRIVKYN